MQASSGTGSAKTVSIPQKQAGGVKSSQSGGSGKEKEKNGVKVVKSTVIKSASKPTWRAVVRKLPPSREFGREQFEELITRVCERLSVPSTTYAVEHVIDGKISRKRGPINGAGFIAFQEEASFSTFIASCDSQSALLYDESLGQIEVTAAPYNRTFRQKVDKNESTYENDPEFIAFRDRLSKGESHATAPLVETEFLSVEEKMKANPLLSYLREKAMEKARRRGGGIRAIEERSSLKREKKERKERKEKDKLSRKEKKRLKLLKKSSSTASVDSGSTKASSASEPAGSTGKGGKVYINSKRPASTGNQVPADSPAAASILQRGSIQKQHDNQATKPPDAPSTAPGSSGPRGSKQAGGSGSGGGEGSDSGRSTGGHSRRGGRGRGGGFGGRGDSGQGLSPGRVLSKENVGNK